MVALGRVVHSASKSVYTFRRWPCGTTDTGMVVAERSLPKGRCRKPLPGCQRVNVRAIKEIDVPSVTIIDGLVDMAETRSTGGLFSMS